jgi:hypothetical protein
MAKVKKKIYSTSKKELTDKITEYRLPYVLAAIAKHEGPQSIASR